MNFESVVDDDVVGVINIVAIINKLVNNPPRILTRTFYVVILCELNKFFGSLVNFLGMFSERDGALFMALHCRTSVFVFDVCLRPMEDQAD